MCISNRLMSISPPKGAVRLKVSHILVVSRLGEAVDGKNKGVR
jgi:hypothetical protein